jgi:nicotinamide-nucleotide amidase
MKAHILSIGTELILGQTVDTNAAWLAQELAGIGIEADRHVTVSDEEEPIREAIRESASRASLLLITGGLGPTLDDMTRDALAAMMGVSLEFHPESFAQIERFFRERGRPMHPENRRQAMLPVGAEALENICGTAPGVHARIGGCEVFVMPGVPHEMKTMFERSVLPRLRADTGGSTIVQRTLRTIAMPEAQVGELIADLMKRGRNPTVGTSAADLIISIRINAGGKSSDEACRLADADAAEIRSRLKHVVFGEGEQTIQGAVADLLRARKLTVSTAESCTGGLIAKRLTDISGSSEYYVQGFVTYANESKSRLLGVPAELIKTHGAVSAEVARAMAESCQRMAATDYALSATGIAGPTGGSSEKPVGLMYVGLASKKDVVVKELRLGETLSREQIRDRAVKIALNLLRLELLGQSV